MEEPMTRQRDRVREILFALASRTLREDGAVEVYALVREARAEHPEIFIGAAERLMEDSAVAKVKDILRVLTDDEDDRPDGQMMIPGLNLPTAINVAPNRFIHTDTANWQELGVGRENRYKNVGRAQSKLDSYDRSMDVLRPLMEEADEGYTVADAKRDLGADDDGEGEETA
jgi:hypothetical protein